MEKRMGLVGLQSRCLQFVTMLLTTGKQTFPHHARILRGAGCSIIPMRYDEVNKQCRITVPRQASAQDAKSIVLCTGEMKEEWFPMNKGYTVLAVRRISRHGRLVVSKYKILDTVFSDISGNRKYVPWGRKDSDTDFPPPPPFGK